MDAELLDALEKGLDEVRYKPLPYKYQEPDQAWRK